MTVKSSTLVPATLSVIHSLGVRICIRIIFCHLEMSILSSHTSLSESLYVLLMMGKFSPSAFTSHSPKLFVFRWLVIKLTAEVNVCMAVDLVCLCVALWWTGCTPYLLQWQLRLASATPTPTTHLCHPPLSSPPFHQDESGIEIGFDGSNLIVEKPKLKQFLCPVAHFLVYRMKL